MYPFLGMRGTGDWLTNMRPQNWRQTLLRLFPNGDAPLTAVMSMLGSESVDDPHYHWWTKGLANQRAALTGNGVFTDAALTVPYTHGAIAGDTLYLRMAAADVDKFRVTHEVMIRCSFDPNVDVVGKAIYRHRAGANSAIGVYLLEADDNSVHHDLSDADVAWIIGSINPEGGGAPQSIMYDPVEWENYTQIFKTAIEETETARNTRLRVGNTNDGGWSMAKEEALQLHGLELEKAFIFGVPSVRTGANGKPERTTAGIRRFITTNKFNFPAVGGIWTTTGDAWLDTCLEQVFRYGKQEKLALCGSGTLLGINRLIKANGTIELTQVTKAYGIAVNQWITPFGILNIKTHPLFTVEPTTRNSMLVIDPPFLKYRYLQNRDTHLKENVQANDADEKKDQWITEAGLEVHHEEAHAWFDGIGLNNFGPTTTTASPTTLATSEPPTTLASTLHTTVIPTTLLTTHAATTLLTSAAPTTL